MKVEMLRAKKFAILLTLLANNRKKTYHPSLCHDVENFLALASAKFATSHKNVVLINFLNFASDNDGNSSSLCLCVMWFGKTD